MDGIITILTIPVMDMAGILTVGASTWESDWDGAWAFPTDMDTLIIGLTIPTMATVAGTIPGPIMDTEDITDTLASVTPTTEVLTGADTTMATITGICMEAAIIRKVITAMAGWIQGTMPDIPGPQRPL